MKVRFVFVPTGLYAAEVRWALTVDGEPAAEGLFSTGVRHDMELVPGSHALELSIRFGLGSRRRRWNLEVPEPRGTEPAASASAVGGGVEPPADILVVRPRYSRWSGNFAKELDIERRAFDADEPLDADEPAPDSIELVPDRPVRATWVLLALLVLVYALQLGFGVDPSSGLSPSVRSLVAQGGLDVQSMAEGQWFRLLSCAFLHAGPLHLLMNSIALIMAGTLVESRLGWRWFTSVYFVSALGGSALSLWLNDGRTVSVGASGAIMGLFVAGLFVASTLPASQRGAVQMQMLRVLIPSMLPLASMGTTRVDVGAHLGGALAGAAVSWPLLRAYRRAHGGERGVESFRDAPLAWVLSAVFVLGSLAAAVGVGTRAYPAIRDEAAAFDALVPDEQIGEGAPSPEQVGSWLETHAGDPRVQIFAADKALEREDFEMATRHVAHGRQALERTARAFPPESVLRLERSLELLHTRIALNDELLPNSVLHADREREAGVEHQYDELDARLQRYPNDPRLRSMAAWRALEKGRYEEVDEHVRVGLEQAPRFADLFTNGLPAVGWLRLQRAIALLERGRNAEAEPLLRRACAGDDGADVAESARERGICSRQASLIDAGSREP